MIRISPQKLNLVAELIRGKKVVDGARRSHLQPQAHRRRRQEDARSRPIANAENNHELDVDSLVVAEAHVGKCAGAEALDAARPRPRRPHPQALLAPDDRRPRSRGVRLMGQKVNPIGLRLGINRTWDSRWFANKGEYGQLLHEDMQIRNVADGGPEAGGGVEDRHRASAQEVPRHDPLGSSGHRHRQEGRRHREASQEGRGDDRLRGPHQHRRGAQARDRRRRWSPPRSPSSSSAASRSAAP